MGTPGQQMELIFDSGSGALVVPYIGCQDCTPHVNVNDVKQEYAPLQSSTARNKTRVFGCTNQANAG